ncbi:SH3 domain-containing protein [Neolewinella xylanilytica]|uniref:SH3 domain-containing protein n=1 Tax=Neolewinella xylanilytica TaxID=1514080 RepID=A0A2S6I9Y6_9BACT|nr:C40 family peptidase [Neolewinella xylanilytica]PPK88317.1 SH3 domain-containing protein [Neolewinella xylanilytica]
MENLTFCGILLFFLLGCQEIGSSREPDAAIEASIGQLRRTYAPDRRTDRVEVAVIRSGDSVVFDGYTTVAAAAASLDSLVAATPGGVNRVRQLPAAEGYALIRVSVANIRTEPGHSSELTSQALMGTPVSLLDYRDGWFLIRTPDRYIAWLEEGALVRVSAEELAEWFSGDLVACAPAQTTVYATDRGIVSELVAGGLVKKIGDVAGDRVPIRLPDGRTGYVGPDEILPYEQLATPASVSVDDVLATAFAQAGKPYLWGGTSPKGMDCSGFTKTAYYLNGYVIPRDASQQVHAGEVVTLDESFSRLERGDLLFFGNYRDDGSERVTHVGFYLGDGRFLHAGADNGYITENSLIEGTADYAEHRRNSLLRARRLREGDPGVVRIDTAFAAVYTRSSSR